MQRPLDQSEIRRAVSPLELFYDLVFVFAAAQLSHHLHDHVTWRGAAETLVLLAAVFGVWGATSFGATLLDITKQRTRFLVVTAMGLGLFMNAGVSTAFSENPWLFVVPFLVTALGIDMAMAALSPTGIMRRHYRHALLWTLLSTPLWIAGALVDADTRLLFWGAAALIDVAGVWLAHPMPGRALHSEYVGFDAEHMLERLRLFIILLLGETVLTTGAVIAHASPQVTILVASVGIFIALVCLWATYFGGGEDIVAEHLLSTSDPIRSVRLGINATYGGLAGLVALAVASEHVILHPTGHGSPELALLLFGGSALYLGVQAWYFQSTVRVSHNALWIGTAAVACAGVSALWLPPLAAVGLLDLLLIGIVAALVRARR